MSIIGMALAGCTNLSPAGNALVGAAAPVGVGAAIANHHSRNHRGYVPSRQYAPRRICQQNIPVYDRYGYSRGYQTRQYYC